GSVRVYKIGETGREITLYRFGMGEGCILTASAILNDTSFPAIATVEQDAEVIMIPSKIFRDWIYHYPIWSEFIFNLLSQRLSSVMTIVEEVAFRRMDIRVAGLLLNHAQANNPIKITHQEIAAELGSSREVISRILDDFSDSDIVRLSRGAIEILDFDLLKSRTAM
ncbi:MAG: Crp/Fnr family transcriptional regulator, partial [Anaerolineales bacterium]